MEELASPISMAVAWHGRLMVLAWVLFFPAGILLARFFKVTPRQRWPSQLDNRFWWHCHLLLQITGGLVVVGSLLLILNTPADEHRSWWLHRYLGWTVIALCATQFVSGLARGSRGGPGDRAVGKPIAGDHYDMTLRRRSFEVYHRTNGYLVMVLSVASVITGLVTAIAPVWMLPVLVLWWILLVVVFIVLQRRGLYMSSHEAIWGPQNPRSADTRVCEELPESEQDDFIQRRST